MSQALAVITQNRPHQTFRVGYDMQVAPLVAGEREQLAHYAGVKSRLHRTIKPPAKPIAPLPPPQEALPTIVDRNSYAFIGPRLRDFMCVGEDVVHPLPSPLAWRTIVSEVCLAHGVTYLELCSIRRAVRIVAARQEAAYRLHHETTMSLPQIGFKLGGKDHTTILHGIRRHTAKLRGEVYRHPVRAKAASV